jgi:hypothetical protein
MSKLTASGAHLGRRRTVGALAPMLLSALFWGCVDPMDVTGVAEVVSEFHQQAPLQDDKLSDKHPEYDPARVVVEEFDGCQVTLNKSASVTRLTLQASGALDQAVKGKIFRSRGAALAALGGAPTLPSIEVVNGALKPFNDGLYAAVELAAEQGEASLVNKHRLLLDLLAELMARSTGGSSAERGPALAAARHVATALTLAGESSAVPRELAAEAAVAATKFEEDGILSKPLGFYTWTPELESIFKRDRWLQKRYVPGVSAEPPFAALAELGLLMNEPGSLSSAYRRTLDLYAGLTDPFFDADPFSVARFVPDASALGDLASVERSFAATLPVAYPGFPFCNPGLAAFPASESAENRMMRQLLCVDEPVAGDTLLDALIQKVQTGELDLTPRKDSGFYDLQLYALETLLAPERASESQHLLLTRAYKEKLVETFKSLLIQTRETHVKQVGLVNATLASAQLEPIEFTVYPKLVVEPFPTFYLRTARAYRFLEGVLNTVLGPEFLQNTARVLEGGSRSGLTLGEELAEKQRLLYGLSAVSADSLGMAPELAADELEAFPLDAARAAALTWVANVSADADVARDPRVSLPVALQTVDLVDYGVYWAVIGVKVLHLQASFPESTRPEVLRSAPYSCVQTGWKTFEPYLLVDQTIQVRRRADLPPLDREEFRALCDAHDTAEAIAAAFSTTP